VKDERPAHDDATLVRRIAEERDERALEELLTRHAPKVTGDLRHRFRHQLQHPDIDEAVNRAALKLWERAGSFDGTQPFGPWFLTIAHRAALDILKGEKRRPRCALEFEPEDHDSVDADDDLARSPRTAWFVEQLQRIINYELKGFEHVVAEADLAAGGPGAADTQWLMRKYKKNKNMVQATRSKVWKKIRATILKREALGDHTKVNL
jgi:DNA-directed RNA polymerase specialized sigma24 family protein